MCACACVWEEEEEGIKTSYKKILLPKFSIRVMFHLYVYTGKSSITCYIHTVHCKNGSITENRMTFMQVYARLYSHAVLQA